MTIYFDSSDIFRAFNGAENSDKEFSQILFALTKNHKLCFSFHHLCDLVAGQNPNYVIPRAEFIDSIPEKQWIRSNFKIDKKEIESFLVYSASEQDCRESIFTSFLGMFEKWAPVAFSNALKNPTVEAYVKEMLTPEGIQLHEKIRKNSAENARRLAFDRKIVKRTMLPGDMDRLRHEKVNEYLKQFAEDAHRELLKMTHPDYYILDEALYRTPDLAWAKEQALEILNNPDFCPYLLLLINLMHNYAEALALEAVTPGKFENKHESDSDDFGHLVGGAYCDVFTCDKRTSQYIGNFRESKLGLARQLSHGEIGKDAFNKELIKLL